MGAMIEVTAIAGLVTVQDAGRPGWMHQGVAPGGALAPASLERANRAAGNAPDAAGLEVVGRVAVRAIGDVVVADDGGDRHALRDGETFALACGEARVRYFAVHGGIDVPAVLGSRSTLLVAALGGHHGRALRRGDRLPVGAATRVAPVAGDSPPPVGATETVRVVPGPDLDRFAGGALDVLLRSTYSVSPRSDRVGVRLAGPPLPRADDDSGVSAPMIRGAIQVPAGGEPIVLGPDHPTTGGYPVLATVVLADVGVVMARPVGAPLRFVRSASGARGK